MAAVLVYVTAPDRDSARRMGRAAVEERLAACANIIDGMMSIFCWQGAIEEAAEAVLILKTVEGRVEALTRRLRALHPYDLPCVVALPIVGGNPDFLAWIATETSAQS